MSLFKTKSLCMSLSGSLQKHTNGCARSHEWASICKSFPTLLLLWKLSGNNSLQAHSSIERNSSDTVESLWAVVRMWSLTRKKKKIKTSYSQNIHSSFWDVAVHKTQAAPQHNFSEGIPEKKITHRFELQQHSKQVSDDRLYNLFF